MVGFTRYSCTGLSWGFTAYTTRDAAHVPATSYLIDFIISYKIRFKTVLGLARAKRLTTLHFRTDRQNRLSV